MNRMLEGDVKYEHIRLQDAWKDLTHTTFAVWVRMQNLDYDMGSGIGKLSTHFGFGRVRFNEILKELERKGYIDVIPSKKRFEKSELTLIRHAIIYGPNSFVKMTNLKEMAFDDFVAKFNHIEEDYER